MTKRPTQREKRAALDSWAVGFGKMTGEDFAEKHQERAKRRQIEDALQRECWNWTQRKERWWRHFVRHVGTERVSNDERLAQLGKGGLSPGWWDLEIWLPAGEYSGMASELKCLRNDLTDWQVYRQKIYEDAGWYTVVIKDEKIRFVERAEWYLSLMDEASVQFFQGMLQEHMARISKIDDWRDK